MIIPSLRSKRKARIEIIPLIDIVFFLLATFVMVSLSMVKNQGVNVNLPSASTGTHQAQDDRYTAISVTDKGEIYFNKERVALGDLQNRLNQLKKTQPDPTVLLNADDGTSYGKAVKVLDEIRKTGIKKVALRTQQR